ncbi:hypothetical protein QFZ68_003325 [Streptomyces sp. V1I6]|nr:hypothetical protein [Streptomyces sp. V1I6]
MAISEEPMAYAAHRGVVAGWPMTNITPGARFAPSSAWRASLAKWGPCPAAVVPAARRHLSGRTTPRMDIDPAPATVTFLPGRGAWMIAPSPMYIPTWLASEW